MLEGDGCARPGRAAYDVGRVLRNGIDQMQIAGVCISGVLIRYRIGGDLLRLVRGPVRPLCDGEKGLHHYRRSRACRGIAGLGDLVVIGGDEFIASLHHKRTVVVRTRSRSIDRIDRRDQHACVGLGLRIRQQFRLAGDGIRRHEFERLRGLRIGVEIRVGHPNHDGIPRSDTECGTDRTRASEIERICVRVGAVLGIGIRDALRREYRRGVLQGPRCGDLYGSRQQ